MDYDCGEKEISGNEIIQRKQHKRDEPIVVEEKTVPLLTGMSNNDE